LAHPGEDPLQLSQDLRSHVLPLPLELFLEVAGEALGVAQLPLELVLLVPAGVGGKQLPLLLELVPQLVELGLVAVELLLHADLLLLQLLARLYSSLRARENALQIHVSDARRLRRLRRLREGRCQHPRQRHEAGQRRPPHHRRVREAPTHALLLLARTPRPSKTGYCRTSLCPSGS